MKTEELAMELNHLVELRTDGFSLQGVLVHTDSAYVWLAEAMIYQGGKHTRDPLIKTLIRVKTGSIRAAAEIRPIKPHHNYAAITVVPGVGCGISAWVGGEEIKGAVLSQDPLEIRDENGRTWKLNEPDVVDTWIDRGRAGPLIAAVRRPKVAANPVSAPSPKPAAKTDANLRCFQAQYRKGSEPVDIVVTAEGLAEAREKADSECARLSPDANFIGMREVPVKPGSSALTESGAPQNFQL